MSHNGRRAHQASPGPSALSAAPSPQHHHNPRRLTHRSELTARLLGLLSATTVDAGLEAAAGASAVGPAVAAAAAAGAGVGAGGAGAGWGRGSIMPAGPEGRGALKGWEEGTAAPGMASPIPIPIAAAAAAGRGGRGRLPGAPEGNCCSCWCCWCGWCVAMASNPCHRVLIRVVVVSMCRRPARPLKAAKRQPFPSRPDPPAVGLGVADTQPVPIAGRREERVSVSV
jgi:hypothetical protein